MTRLFLKTSWVVRLLGMIDLVALLVVVGSLAVGAYLSEDTPLIILAGVLYTFLWANKAYFTSRVAGAAFPAVFGLGPRSEFNINVMWYVFSTLVLCGLAVVMMYTIQTSHLGEVLVSAAAVISCGRATIPALVVGRALAAVYERERIGA